MRFFFLLIIGCALYPLTAQNEIQWAIQGKTKHLSNIVEVALLANGDGIFCGDHDSLVQFGPYAFEGPRHRSSSGSTRTSAYIGRISPQGILKWVKQIATADNGLFVSDMAVGPKGNIWLSASCAGTIKFIDGNEFQLAEMGFLIAKVSPEGNLLWGRAYDGLGSKMHYYHLEPRKDGNCFILANHESGIFGKSTLPRAGSGQYAQYLGLIDALGKPLWAHSLGGPGGKITAMDMDLDKDGNVLIAGHFRAVADVKIVDERNGSARGTALLKPPGIQNSKSGEPSNLMRAFLGRYDKNTGKPLEVHLYGGAKMCNITAIKADSKGNVYLGLALYGEDLEIGGKTVPAYPGNDITMVIAKLNKDWRCLWYKSFLKSKSDYVNDFSLDGNKLYAACMIAQGNLSMDEVSVSSSGLWSGVILKMSTLDGYCFQDFHWAVGTAKCVEIRNGEGYAGGWFHYTTSIAGERFAVGERGQFNAVLCRISSEDQSEPIDSTPLVILDTSLSRAVETQHQIIVENERINLTIWDEKEVDGDIISIRFNNEWVIRNYTLSASPKTFTLKTQSGIINSIEMFAEDVGRIPPATTAMIISDGARNHKVSLRSSPELNGRIEIQWKPK